MPLPPSSLIPLQQISSGTPQLPLKSAPLRRTDHSLPSGLTALGLGLGRWACTPSSWAEQSEHRVNTIVSLAPRVSQSARNVVSVEIINTNATLAIIDQIPPYTAVSSIATPQHQDERPPNQRHPLDSAYLCPLSEFSTSHQIQETGPIEKRRL